MSNGSVEDLQRALAAIPPFPKAPSTRSWPSPAREVFDDLVNPNTLTHAVFVDYLRTRLRQPNATHIPTTERLLAALTPKENPK